MQELVKFFVNFIFKKKLQNIDRFKDIHLNESCYIFGDGLSVKYFDLEKFSDLTSIIVGKLYLHKDYSKLKSKYIVSCDPLWLTPFFLSIKNKYGANPQSKNKKFLVYDPLAASLKDFIKENNETKFFVDISNFPFNYNSKNINFLSKYSSKNSFNELFYKLNSIQYFGQTLPTSIVLAIYMGFRNIYLVGCDYTHYPSRNVHWFEKQKSKLWYKKHLKYLKEFFDEVKKHAKIHTITLDGTSNNLDYIKYINYTNYQPIYRENNEILSETNIKTLSSSDWFGYNI